jgi:hypothetical protein
VACQCLPAARTLHRPSEHHGTHVLIIPLSPFTNSSLTPHLPPHTLPHPQASEAQALALHTVVLTTYGTLAQEAPAKERQACRIKKQGTSSAPIQLLEEDSGEEEGQGQAGGPFAGVLAMRGGWPGPAATWGCCIGRFLICVCGLPCQVCVVSLHAAAGAGTTAGPARARLLLQHIITSLAAGVTCSKTCADLPPTPTSPPQASPTSLPSPAAAGCCTRCAGTAWCWTRPRASRTTARWRHTPPGACTPSTGECTPGRLAWLRLLLPPAA